MRIALLAEGAGETAGASLRRPGREIPESDWGAAHVLVARAVDHVETESRAPVFIEPLRVRARVAKGSDLHAPIILRRLLAWARPEFAPDLAVVLVDQDGKRKRDKELRPIAQKARPTAVLGISIEEFESWLIGDISAVRETLAMEISEPRAREKLKPSEAKQMLDDWFARSSSGNRTEMRRALVNACDLEEVGRQCGSFDRFLSDLREALLTI